MADYYPLISRAVANLGTSTPDQRRDLYDRATAALIGQLRNSDPPIAEADILREQTSLEDAIRRVETEVGGGVAPGMVSSSVSPAVEPAPVAAGPQVAEPPVAEAAAAEPAPPAETEPVAPYGVPSEDLPHREPEPAAQTPPVAEEVRPPLQMASVRQAATPVIQAVPPPPEEVAPAPAPNPAVQEAADERWRETGPLRPRPPAPRLDRGERRWVRAAIIGVAIAAVVGLTATAAIMLKHQPSEFLPQAPPAPVAGDGEGKFQDRLAGDAPAQTAPPPPQQQAAAPAPAPQPGAPAPQPGSQQAAAIGVLQRAILVEEPPEGSQDPKETQGRVRWRLDSVSAGPGEPLDVAVRAEVDLGAAGLKADIVLRRNRDAALPASHTLEVKFAPASAQSVAVAVRDMLTPEMRDDATQRGTPLAGIPVPVTDNLFLVGLSNLGSDIQRNIDLMRARNWFMLTLRFANGRRALLLIEKGPTGTRTVADALQAWQQG